MKHVKCIVLGGVVQHYIARHDTLYTPSGWHSGPETCSSIFVMNCILWYAFYYILLSAAVGWYREHIPHYTLFRFTATLDMPPQTAVNKRWCYIGMLIHACNWKCRLIKSDTSDTLQTTELFPSFLSLCSRETRLWNTTYFIKRNADLDQHTVNL